MPVIAGAIIGRKIYKAHKKLKKEKEEFLARKAADKAKAKKWLDKNAPNRNNWEAKKKKNRTLELKIRNT